MKDKILVILPVKNCNYHIKKVIDSVVNQSYKKYTLVIIDYGSNDGTRNVLKKINNLKFPNIKVHFTNNTNYFSLINFALKEYIEDHDWFTIQGQSEVNHNSKFQELLSYVKTKNVNGITYNFKEIELFKENGRNITKTNNFKVLYSTEIIDKIGYFNLNVNGSETDYINRFKRVYKLSNTNKILALQYINLNPQYSINHNERKKFILRSNEELLRMDRKKEYFVDYTENYTNKGLDLIYSQLKSNTIPKVESERTGKVLVIMAAYNAEEFIEMSINSVLNQTYKNLKLCVINDKSTDKTASVVRKLQKKDDRIVLFNSDNNNGAYFSRNVALYKYMFDCDYWTIHDADDFMYTYRLEKQLELADKFKAVTCKYKRIEWKSKSKFTLRGGDHSNILYNKILLQEIGYYDSSTRFAADSEYHARTKANYGNNSIGQVNEVLFEAYLHGENEIVRNPIGSPQRKSYVAKYKAEHAIMNDTNRFREFLVPDAYTIDYNQTERGYFNKSIIIKASDKPLHLLNLLKHLRKNESSDTLICILNDGSHQNLYRFIDEYLLDTKNVIYATNFLNIYTDSINFITEINKISNDVLVYDEDYLLTKNDLYENLDVVGSMASQAIRQNNIKDVSCSIIEQVDILNLYLNDYNYNEIDNSLLMNDKIQLYIHNENKGDLGDVGKFYDVDKIVNYHLTIDDDIIYPEDYVSVMMSKLNEHNDNIFLSNHGRSFDKLPIESYYNDKSFLVHFNNTLDVMTNIQFPGTGVMLYNNKLGIKFAYFKTINMCDVWVGIFANNNNINVFALDHKKNWIKPIIFEEDVKIYNTHKNDDSVQTDLVNSKFKI